MIERLVEVVKENKQRADQNEERVKKLLSGVAMISARIATIEEAREKPIDLSENGQ